MGELKGKKVVTTLCGGNIDTTLLGRCLERGMAADGRLVTFSVTVSDRPGGIAELARTISNVGVSIKDIVHERAWVRTNAFAVGVRMLAETRNRKHSKELFKLMRESYGEVEIIGYYDSPEDYVEGNMNIQYNMDRRPTLHVEDMEEDIAKFRSPDRSTDSDVEDSEEQLSKMKLGNRTARAATRVN